MKSGHQPEKSPTRCMYGFLDLFTANDHGVILALRPGAGMSIWYGNIVDYFRLPNRFAVKHVP